MRTALYLNGNIYTMDVGRPRAQALAIDLDSGSILAVGDNDEIRRFAGQYHEAIDLRGRTVIPGFIDAHIHLLATAYRTRRVDAGGCTSEEAVAALVQERAAHTTSGQWIEGGYWDRNLWSDPSFPTRASLDAAAPEHPVALWSKDGHLLWCNTFALQRAGITAETPAPPTGAILRDGSGEPTGVLQEGDAIRLVTDVIEAPDREQSLVLLRQMIIDLQRRGITSVHAIEGAFGLSLFRELRREGGPGVRIEVILPHQLLPEIGALGLLDDADALLHVGGIKIFADGTLGSQTAAMLESFEDNPGNFGILAMPEQEMLETVHQSASKGLMVAIHAIGDRAAHVALNSIEYAQHQLALANQRPTARSLRYRLEHVQLITPEDLERMRRLGVVASIQPFHAVIDRDIAERYWGPRHRRAYAYRTMRDLGIPLALGSDAPVELYDPLRILYSATVRSDPAGQRPPWLPDQALTVQDALWGYTLGAAYAGGEEAHKGSLTPGKLGDAAVLHEDLLTRPQRAIAENGVRATILGGKVVYGEV
jgi:predicted amidohydrolase YtcJ